MTPEHWVLGVGCVRPKWREVSFSPVPQDKPFAVARRGPSHQLLPQSTYLLSPLLESSALMQEKKKKDDAVLGSAATEKRPDSYG